MSRPLRRAPQRRLADTLRSSLALAVAAGRAGHPAAVQQTGGESQGPAVRMGHLFPEGVAPGLDLQHIPEPSPYQPRAWGDSSVAHVGGPSLIPGPSSGILLPLSNFSGKEVSLKF